ncbi:MAG: S8 family serine peptidase [Solirubrobacteraceae bacterium]
MFFRRILTGAGADIVWTFSAGNNCMSGPSSPWAAKADLANVLDVAAADADGTLASFSNYGVVVAAPGGVEPTQPAIDVNASCNSDNVLDQGRCGLLSSTVGSCAAGYCPEHGEMAGTSMAAPVVAGIAALVAAKHPSFTAAQIGACITSTAGTGEVGSTKPPDGQPGGAYADPPLAYTGEPIPIVNAAAAVTCAGATSTGTGTGTGTGGSGSSGSGSGSGGSGSGGSGSDGSGFGVLGGQYQDPLAASDNDTCALVQGGSVDCWGANNEGELGDGGTESSSSTLVPVSGITDATALAAGWGHTCALLASGSVDCWGNNCYGQLGNVAAGQDASAPVPVGITNATAIAAADDHMCVVLAGGGVDCWGDNYVGVTIAGVVGSPTPVPVGGIANATALGVGAFHACALLASGGVDCWGENSSGELGDGSTTSSATPVEVSGLP